MPLMRSMEFSLFPHQEEALNKMRNGCILNGGVGSGKTLTSLSFYKKHFNHLDLYVITTAKNRDTGDWEEEADMVGVSITEVDSWNNINNYIGIENSFFIFDEQRAVGYGVWGKSLIRIAKNNKWVMLSATPGDTWMDYLTVFIANGYYRNKTDFVEQHVEYDPWVKYPKVKKYHNVGKLLRYRKQILIPMEYEKQTKRRRQLIYSEYDKDKYQTAIKDRWNVFEDKPIENASELLQVIRRIPATDPDRIFNAKVMMDIHDRMIVFYNYNYELDILIEIAEDINKDYYQWNGHVHEEIPDKEQWLYFVQYTAGAEGWNCITTNVIMFYSVNYSFRYMEQSEGRIDRINTPYENLEYYFLTSGSKIDRDVLNAVNKKKNFNASNWLKRSGLQFH